MWAITLYKLNYFAAVASNCNPNTDNPDSGTFFGFPSWWKYINTGQFDTTVNPPVCTPVVDFPNGIWAIGFAVIDMLLYLAGIVAVISIIIAGISYITSQGNAEKAASSRRRIVNSLIGVAAVVIASVVVRFIGDRVG